MSTRQRRIARVVGALILASSLAAVTSMLPTGGTPVANPVQPTGHVFVPTTVPLPASDEEPAPTF